MIGARLSWPVKRLTGGQHKLNIFVNIRTILNNVVSLGQLNIPIRIYIII